MVHVNKAKGGYIGYVVAKNGEILSTTEIVKTKENVFKNLLAQSEQFNVIRMMGKDKKSKLLSHFAPTFIVQDNTLAFPTLLFCAKSEKKGKVQVWVISEEEKKEYKLKVKKFNPNEK